METERPKDPKIIELFSPSPAAGEAAAQEAPAGDSPETTPALDTYLNMNRFTELLECLTDLRKNDPQAFKERNIDVRSAAIKDATPAELFTWVNQSNEADWKEHPSFYSAIVEALQARDLLDT